MPVPACVVPENYHWNLSHGGVFGLNPHPSGNSNFTSYCPLNILVFGNPFPLGIISNNNPWYRYFLEGPEGVKWELGLANGKMGFRSLGLGFGDWENCQKWEGDKYLVTKISRDITYFLGLRNSESVSITLFVSILSMLIQIQQVQDLPLFLGYLQRR